MTNVLLHLATNLSNRMFGTEKEQIKEIQNDLSDSEKFMTDYMLPCKTFFIFSISKLKAFEVVRLEYRFKKLLVTIGKKRNAIIFRCLLWRLVQIKLKEIIMPRRQKMAQS